MMRKPAPENEARIDPPEVSIGPDRSATLLTDVGTIHTPALLSPGCIRSTSDRCLLPPSNPFAIPPSDAGNSPAHTHTSH